MPSPLRVEAVLELPVPLVPGTLYFVRRDDDHMDVVRGALDGTPIYQRQPITQILVDSRPADALLPAGGEFGRFFATCPLELLQTTSALRADVAATNEAVLPVMVGAVTVARATFAAGQAQAVIEILQPIVPAPSLLLFKSPAVQDPTLAGVVGTWTARRL